MRKTANIGWVLMLVLGMTTVVYAASDKDSNAGGKKSDAGVEVVSVETDEVQGTISSIGKDYVSIDYAHDEAQGIEYEMRLPLEEDTQLTNKKSMKELKVGDIIKITFDNMTERDADGTEKSRRKAKSLTFIKAGATESSALVSE